MESSRFLQISNEILLEYVYTDQTNPDTYNTNNYPIEILNNGYTDSNYMFNTDSVFSELGNKRDISATSINENKSRYVYLNTSLGVPYNDFDTNLTDSINLIQSFSPHLDIEYDTIKIHFASGFDFIGYDGLIIESLIPKRGGNLINTSSYTFLKSDNPEFNANPFLLGSKLYSTYIEWKIPSLFYLVNSFNSNDSNSLSYKLTNGQGFLKTPPINIKISGIYKTEIENGYRFFNIQEIGKVSLPNRDIYDLLSASVTESINGDFFELIGLIEGSTFSNFIAKLNSQGNDYIAIHQIIVNEQIGENFIQTSNQMFTQTNDFDEPIRFRPIILNSSTAVSFSIDYTLRLYNRDDNTQIIKKSRYSSFNPEKYGRRLLKIDMGTVPTVSKIYNKIESDTGNNIQLNDNTTTNQDLTEKLVTKTKYITSFRDKINIKTKISPVKIQNLNNE